jgi:hypothetical protein
MNRRADTPEKSTVLMNLRVGPEEADEIRATAEYLGLNYSEYLRLCHREARARILADGKRPPKRPRKRRAPRG